MARQTSAGFSRLQIGLHWGIAALVAFQLLFGESMTAVFDAAQEGGTVSLIDQILGSAHYWFGLAILGLVVVRLAVRLIKGAPAHDPNTSPLMALAAKLVHWAFYGLLAAAPILGLLTLYVNPALGDIHALVKPAFLVLIAAHAGAAMFHQFVLKDGLLKRMLQPAT